jgi:mevalonate pyrophosphate decarboxylase
VPKRITSATEYIARKDFNGLSEIMIIMRESNESNAFCAATFSPNRFLMDESYVVINVVHELNDRSWRAMMAYSFDAGWPEPSYFALFSDVPLVKNHLLKVCWIEDSAVRVAKSANGITCHRR